MKNHIRELKERFAGRKVVPRLQNTIPNYEVFNDFVLVHEVDMGMVVLVFLTS